MARRAIRNTASRCAFALLVGLPQAIAAQCPMCRTALESPEARELALAFNRGILFLLAIPFLAIAAISWLLRAERRRGAFDPQPPES